jgi:hypothetical protein
MLGISKQLSQAAAINRALLETASLANTNSYAMPNPEGIMIRGDVPNEELRDEIMDLVASLSTSSPVTDALQIRSLRQALDPRETTSG